MDLDDPIRRIITTVEKAKHYRPMVEKMITLAKRDTLHSRRQAAAYLMSDDAVKKLFDTLGPRSADRIEQIAKMVWDPELVQLVHNRFENSSTLISKASNRPA